MYCIWLHNHGDVISRGGQDRSLRVTHSTPMWPGYTDIFGRSFLYPRGGPSFLCGLVFFVDGEWTGEGLHRPASESCVGWGKSPDDLVERTSRKRKACLAPRIPQATKICVQTCIRVLVNDRYAGSLRPVTVMQSPPRSKRGGNAMGLTLTCVTRHTPELLKEFCAVIFYSKPTQFLVVVVRFCGASRFIVLFVHRETQLLE